MKLLFYLLRSKMFFFLLTAAIILSLNLIPLLTHIRHSPPDRTFAMIHNNSQDFYFYQSLMNEGANGVWLTTDPYTTEPHQSSVIFSYFLWLGKFSKLLGLPYAITYHLVRIIFGIFLLSVVCYLLFFLKIPYPRLAFLFFLFASPFMKGSQPYMYWWTGMDAIRRVAYLPHHMFGNLALTLLIISLLFFWQTKKKKFFIISVFLSFALAFIHPPSLFIILLILPPTIIIFYLFNTLHFTAGDLKWLLGCWVIGLLLLLFMYAQSAKGFPWSQYIDWEKKLQFPLGKELIGAFGILFPFAILGAVKAFLSKRFDYIFIAVWFFLPIIFVPIAPYLSISNIRLVQGAPYVPLAILAVLGVKTIEEINRARPKIPIVETVLNAITSVNPMRGYFAKKNTTKEKLGVSEQFGIEGVRKEKFVSEEWQSKVPEHFIKTSVLIIFIVFTFPTLSWSLKDQIREFWPVYSNIYLDKKLFPAFTFINNTFPKKTNTISTFYTGNYLPAFTHTVSFAGHFGYTYNVEKKQAEIDNFFKNKMKPQEAKEFLLSNKIDLIFQGPEEKPLYNTYLYPEILRPVYDKEGITIYTLKQKT